MARRVAKLEQQGGGALHVLTVRDGNDEDLALNRASISPKPADLVVIICEFASVSRVSIARL